MTMLACIPITGAPTLAEVGAASLSAADNTYTQQSGVNVKFVANNGTTPILQLGEASQHIAIGPDAAVDTSLTNYATSYNAVVAQRYDTAPAGANYMAGIGSEVFLDATMDLNNIFGVYGSTVYVYNETGNNYFLVGIFGEAANRSTDTVDYIYGLSYYAYNYSTGRIGYALGEVVGVSNTQENGIIDYAGGVEIYIDNASASNPIPDAVGVIVGLSGSIDNAVGVDITNVVGNTSAFALRTGTGLVQFGDRLTVNQNSTTGAVPTLRLKQADLSEEFIRFETTVGAGNPIDTAALGAYYGKARVYVEGVGAKWLALYD